MDAQLIELNGKLAIQDSTLDDFGCERIFTRHSKMRAYDTGLDPKELPIPIYWDSNRQAWYIKSRIGPSRDVFFSHGAFPDRKDVDIESVALPVEKLDPGKVARRLSKLEEMVRDSGNKFYRFNWYKGKVTNKARELFRVWAEKVLSGVELDDDDLWKELYDKDSETADRLYNTVEPTRTVPQKRSVNFGDVLLLFGPKEHQVPDVIVGNLPEVNWCSP